MPLCPDVCHVCSCARVYFGLSNCGRWPSANTEVATKERVPNECTFSRWPMKRTLVLLLLCSLASSFLPSSRYCGAHIVEQTEPCRFVPQQPMLKRRMCFCPTDKAAVVSSRLMTSAMTSVRAEGDVHPTRRRATAVRRTDSLHHRAYYSTTCFYDQDKTRTN